MPPQLTVDDVGGVGHERVPALGVKALRRLHQAEVGDLDEVVERFPTTGVPSGQSSGQRKEAGNQAVVATASCRLSRSLGRPLSALDDVEVEVSSHYWNGRALARP